MARVIKEITWSSLNTHTYIQKLNDFNCSHRRSFVSIARLYSSFHIVSLNPFVIISLECSWPSLGSLFSCGGNSLLRVYLVYKNLMIYFSCSKRFLKLAEIRMNCWRSLKSKRRSLNNAQDLKLDFQFPIKLPLCAPSFSVGWRRGVKSYLLIESRILKADDSR